jgi:hypothetical protein
MNGHFYFLHRTRERPCFSRGLLTSRMLSRRNSSQISNHLSRRPSWANALDGNGGGSPTFVAAANHGNATLGHCGLGTTNHVVWAVINHGGEFAVLKSCSPLPGWALWQQAYFTPQEISDSSISGENADPGSRWWKLSNKTT